MLVVLDIVCDPFCRPLEIQVSHQLEIQVLHLLRGRLDLETFLGMLALLGSKPVSFHRED